MDDVGEARVKKRYLYSILFGVPGFLFSGIIATFFSGFVLGLLWIFVFGDNPWPSIVETIMPTLIITVFITVWLVFIGVGFLIGKHLEPDPVMNKRHVWAAACATILPLLFIVFYQLRVGNFGPKSDGERCSDYCQQEGYSASSMPPRDSGDRTCICMDDFGQETRKVPIEELSPP
jgi:hypothetical protein